MKKGTVVLLGFGMQGKAALHDLVNNSNAAEIIVADNNINTDTILAAYSAERVRACRIDVTDESELVALVRKGDVIVESLPPQFALMVGKIAATEGVNLVSSMYYLNPGEQDAKKINNLEGQLRVIDRLANKNGATILTEFGMDPGIDLVLGARALSELDKVDEFYSYGAGFPTPEAANNPLRYKFTWSVNGVIHSYLRPGKVISDGRVIEVKADEVFSKKNRHLLEIAEIDSPLECYVNGNTEHYVELFGIRDTVREMGRYACRLPGWRIRRRLATFEPRRMWM